MTTPSRNRAFRHLRSAMRHSAVLSAMLLLLTSVCATAQDRSGAASQDTQLDIPRSSDPGKQPFLRMFLADQATIWTSPFHKSSYSSATMKKYVIPFTLITGALVATDRRTLDKLPNTEDQSTWSLRVSQIGAPYTLAGMAAGMYLVSRVTHNRKARETGFLGAEAILHSQIVTQGLKLVTRRDRPFQSKEAGEGGTAFYRGGDSFPSGHASGSFALATIFAYEYGHDHKWVPFVAYGLSSAVSLSRLSAQKHWPSDVFVGATTGFLVGRFVYKRHHNPSVDAEVRGIDRFVPNFAFTGRQFSLLWSL